LFPDNHFGNPGGAYNGRYDKGNPELIKFKKLGRVSGESKRNQEEKKVE